MRGRLGAPPRELLGRGGAPGRCGCRHATRGGEETRDDRGVAACPMESRRYLCHVGCLGSCPIRPRLTATTLFRDAASPSRRKRKKFQGMGRGPSVLTPSFPRCFEEAASRFEAASNVSRVTQGRKQRHVLLGTPSLGWQTAAVPSVRLGRSSCMTQDLPDSCSSAPCSSCL